MSPKLQTVIINGASRHRLDKGFILLSNRHLPVTKKTRDIILESTNGLLNSQAGLSGFRANTRSEHISVIGLSTPFLPVYNVRKRDHFINSLAIATQIMIQVAHQNRCELIPAGVNPFYANPDDKIPALCADFHQIEIYDDGEIERIYNLYRQFLPELLALSTHAGILGGEIQKDFSVRMRVNPVSFLPRYLSQFSTEHLRNLRRIMRKDYGLTNLRQMDINPLSGGDLTKLMEDQSKLLVSMPAAIELRFIDAQCAFPFIKTQIILFQAIAIYGRTLARAGKRLPYMRDEVIDENKALAIQNGPGAILKPDVKFKKDGKRRGLSFHDEGHSERSTTALLITLNRLLLPYLRVLDCQYPEIAPIVLGAELRNHGKQCFANYGEYQRYLHYTNSKQFSSMYQQMLNEHLTSPHLDAMTQFNISTYTSLAESIQSEWTEKLKRLPRIKGHVKWYDSKKGFGFVRSVEGQEYRIHRNDFEGIEKLETGYPLSFEVITHGKQTSAVRIRASSIEQSTGYISHYNPQKGFGFISTDDHKRVYFHQEAIIDGNPITGAKVSFQVIEQERGFKAIEVIIYEQPRETGTVKWFNKKKQMGFITMRNGKDIYVNQRDLVEIEYLKPKQVVTFEINRQGKPKAVRVRRLKEG